MYNTVQKNSGASIGSVRCWKETSSTKAALVDAYTCGGQYPGYGTRPAGIMVRICCESKEPKRRTVVRCLRRGHRGRSVASYRSWKPL